MGKGGVQKDLERPVRDFERTLKGVKTEIK